MQGLNSRFGPFGLVEVLVNHGGLRFTESHEVDEIGKNLDQSVVSGLGQVGECEVVDAALETVNTDLMVNEKDRGSIPLLKAFGHSRRNP